ncbi:MAG: ribosomal-processing cysteine protease Prp [Desulfitobacteriaceae bacterium]|nr:ribosomal-processing cysteine protease Prp [Desulfitobacteriaceae bacterium]MDI6879213.1 ribosomal-processing cysteine protease Prp [Desulfitobacteriaceae bacterium]MDI6914140.1 ribosomal-processing cysteine protease Prp [Desulfitobacteriaceae bacterium]
MRFAYWLDETERIRGFELSGHAGFGEDGQDIVCAGVSALSIAAANGLEYFLNVPPMAKDDEGFLTCRIELASLEELDNAQWILRTLLLGVESIQDAYGKKYVMIEQRRWTPC